MDMDCVVMISPEEQAKYERGEWANAMIAKRKIMRGDARIKRQSAPDLDCANVSAFLEDSCVTGPRGFIGADSLYAKYVEYCNNSDTREVAPSVFGKALRKLVPNIQKRRLRVGPNHRENVYFGIALK